VVKPDSNASSRMSLAVRGSWAQASEQAVAPDPNPAHQVPSTLSTTAVPRTALGLT